MDIELDLGEAVGLERLLDWIAQRAKDDDKPFLLTSTDDLNDAECVIQVDTVWVSRNARLIFESLLEQRRLNPRDFDHRGYLFN